jgi:micrococcal nuclease
VNRRALAAVAVVALVAVAGCTVSLDLGGSASTETRTATVVYVVDGDTVDVEFADGNEDTVRLLGVDSPEVSGDVSPREFEGVPDTERGRECLQRWGERASEYARDRLAGETVTVRLDPESDERGYYDRLLAYIVVGNASETAADGESFNRALLANGYARLYDSEFTERDDYAAVEERARENDTGLWACAS